MKQVSPPKILLVLAISALLFFSGFGLSTFLLQSQVSETQKLQEDIKTEILGIEVEQDILLQNPCKLSSLNTLSSTLSDVERKISLLKDKSETLVEDVRNIHIILQVKHWQLVQKSVEECDSPYVPVLYFFSDEVCNDCAVQGVILTYIKQNNPNVMIYNFNTDFDFSVIKTLEQIYDISVPVEAPAIVIGNSTYTGLYDSATLLTLISQENRNFNKTVA
jgi:hypothetical protein